jgi:CHAT domain-containing protein
LLDNLVEYERRLGLAWTKEDAPSQRLPVQPAALTNVENDLHPDEALLEYVLDDPTPFCITVTRRGAHIQALPVGRKEVEKLVQQFVDDVRAKGAGIEASKRLFRVLLEPIPEAKTATRLIIAPDGMLNLLPFEAVRDNQGEYLLKSRIISYVPSGTLRASGHPALDKF